MEGLPTGGRVGCSASFGLTVKGSVDSRRAPHLRQRRFPELLLAPHSPQCIAIETSSTFFVPLCRDAGNTASTVVPVAMCSQGGCFCSQEILPAQESYLKELKIVPVATTNRPETLQLSSRRKRLQPVPAPL